MFRLMPSLRHEGTVDWKAQTKGEPSQDPDIYE